MNIRDEITARRRSRIAAEGHELGTAVPRERMVPVVRFSRKPLVICEIKRRSPSRGAIRADMDPVEQARHYRASGCRFVSVLTEEDHFSGSLADLTAVKSAFPDLAVLRKDFLIDVEDVDVSFRAGADAVLLIASMMSGRELGVMLEAVGRLGIEALVEVHSRDDIAKVRPYAPALIGINSRNLETFAIDPLLPAVLRHGLDWPADVVYESGIFEPYQADTAYRAGFSGILVGEAVVKTPGLAAELAVGYRGSEAVNPPGRPTGFWAEAARILFSRGYPYGNGAVVETAEAPGSDRNVQPDRSAQPDRYEHPDRHPRKDPSTKQERHERPRPDLCQPGRVPRPLVKICGITNEEDALEAVRLGADILGFLFAPSPRRTSLALLRHLKGIPALRAGVVVWGSEANGIPDPEILAAVDEGLLDVLQLSGDESPGFCRSLPLPWYKTLRPRNTDETNRLALYPCPRHLIDAFHPSLAGGTGRELDPDIAREFAAYGSFWIAGGLNPENIARIITRYRPELVDVSSGLESEPGKKDPNKIAAYFKEIESVTMQG